MKSDNELIDNALHRIIELNNIYEHIDKIIPFFKALGEQDLIDKLFLKQKVIKGIIELYKLFF